MKKSVFRWCLISITAWTLLGCHRFLMPQQIDSEEIPDGEYNVTAYKGLYSKYYAVLFDIPHDEKKVVMIHTEFTEPVGRDRPGEYIERFKKRIKFYRAFRISDRDGTVRGYLLISTLLDQQMHEDSGGAGIIIRILDPALQAQEPR